MLTYLKENGYPISIWIETTDAEDEKEEWKGYISVVTNEYGKIIDEFYHDNLRDRVYWSKGFFKGIEHGPNKLNKIFVK